MGHKTESRVRSDKSNDESPTGPPAFFDIGVTAGESES